MAMATSPVKGPLSESAKASTASVLQSTVVDLIDLSLIGKQAHWNVIGRNFRSVHLQLDELVSAARSFTDLIAERAAAIGASPDGKARTVAETSGLPDYPEDWQSAEVTVERIVETLERIIERLRARIDETDKTDLVTQDILIEISRELEKQHWMWQAMRA